MVAFANSREPSQDSEQTPTAQERGDTRGRGAMVDREKTPALNDGQTHLKAKTELERNADLVREGFETATNRREEYLKIINSGNTAHSLGRPSTASDLNLQGQLENVPNTRTRTDFLHQDRTTVRQALRQGEAFQDDYEKLAILHFRKTEASTSPSLALSESELADYKKLRLELAQKHAATFNIEGDDARVFVEIKLLSEVAKLQTDVILTTQAYLAEVAKEKPDIIRVAELTNGKSREQIELYEAEFAKAYPNIEALRDLNQLRRVEGLTESTSLIQEALVLRLKGLPDIEEPNEENKGRLEEIKDAIESFFSGVVNLVGDQFERPEDNVDLKIAHLDRMFKGYDPALISQEVQENLADLPHFGVAGLRLGSWQSKVGLVAGGTVGFFSSLNGAPIRNTWRSIRRKDPIDTSHLGKKNGSVFARAYSTGTGAALGAGAVNLHDRTYGDTATAVANLKYLVQGLSKEQVEELTAPLNDHVSKVFKGKQLSVSSEKSQEMYEDLMKAQVGSLPPKDSARIDELRRAERLDSGPNSSFHNLSIEAKGEILAILIKNLYEDHANGNLSEEQLDARAMQFDATLRTYSNRLSSGESNQLIAQVDRHLTAWGQKEEFRLKPNSVESLYSSIFVISEDGDSRNQHMQSIFTASSEEPTKAVAALSIEQRATKVFDKMVQTYEASREATEAVKQRLQTDLDQEIKANLAGLTQEQETSEFFSHLNQKVSEWGAEELDRGSFQSIFASATGADPDASALVLQEIRSGFNPELAAQELISVHRHLHGFWERDYKDLSPDQKRDLEGEVTQITQAVLLGLTESQQKQVIEIRERLMLDATGNSLANIIGKQVPSNMVPGIKKITDNGAKPEPWQTYDDYFYATASLDQILNRIIGPDAHKALHEYQDARAMSTQIANNPRGFSQGLNSDSRDSLDIAMDLHRMRYGIEAVEAGSFTPSATNPEDQLHALETRLTIESGINVVKQTEELYETLWNQDLTPEEKEKAVIAILLPEHLSPAERLRFGLAMRDEILPGNILEDTEKQILEDFLENHSPLYFNGMDFADSIWKAIEQTKTESKDNRTADAIVAAIEANYARVESDQAKQLVSSITVGVFSQIKDQGQPLFVTLSREVPHDRELAEIGYALIKHDPDGVDQLSNLGASPELLDQVRHIIALETRIRELEEMLDSPQP